MARRPLPKIEVAVVDQASRMMPDWYDFFRNLITTAISAPAYGTLIKTDAASGGSFLITATNGTAFTIDAPANPVSGQLLTYIIKNTSGGALGVVTWNAVFKLAPWTQPANGFSRSITYQYIGTSWVELSRTAVDVPN